MDIANNWTIVIGIATVISFVLGWSHKAHLQSILKSQEKLMEKAITQFQEKLNNHQAEIKLKGEEKFVQEIANIVNMKALVREAKTTFRGQMIISSVVLVAVSVLFVTIYPLIASIQILFVAITSIVGYLSLVLIALLANGFVKILKIENKVSRYMEGESLETIFK